MGNSGRWIHFATALGSSWQTGVTTLVRVIEKGRDMMTYQLSLPEQHLTVLGALAHRHRHHHLRLLQVYHQELAVLQQCDLVHVESVQALQRNVHNLEI